MNLDNFHKVPDNFPVALIKKETKAKSKAKAKPNAKPFVKKNTKVIKQNASESRVRLKLPHIAIGDLAGNAMIVPDLATTLQSVLLVMDGFWSDPFNPVAFRNVLLRDEQRRPRDDRLNGKEIPFKVVTTLDPVRDNVYTVRRALDAMGAFSSGPSCSSIMQPSALSAGHPIQDLDLDSVDLEAELEALMDEADED